MLAATLAVAMALTTPLLRPALTRPHPRCPTAVNMAAPGQLLSGCALPRISDGAKVDLGELLSAPVTTLVIFGTYPADFNMIEYAQKVRHYWPQLKAKGVDSGLIVVNGSPDSCKRLAEILDLPADVELLSDEAGEAGRRFGVSTGWLPDSDLNPYLKLLGMVITGYLGNPWGKSEWIESSLAQGQQELAPTDDRCLTQLGGCAVVKGAEETYSWRDGGICNTANFEELLAAL